MNARCTAPKQGHKDEHARTRCPACSPKPVRVPTFGAPPALHPPPFLVEREDDDGGISAVSPSEGLPDADADQSPAEDDLGPHHLALISSRLTPSSRLEGFGRWLDEHRSTKTEPSRGAARVAVMLLIERFDASPEVRRAAAFYLGGDPEQGRSAANPSLAKTVRRAVLGVLANMSRANVEPERRVAAIRYLEQHAPDEWWTLTPDSPEVKAAFQHAGA